MSYNNMAVNEQIQKALTTSDINEIISLIKSPAMIVRRALARNNHTPADIINRLVMDPVMNVSYAAAMNPKSTVKREFDEKRMSPCVTCKNIENKLQCTEGCTRKEDHSF